MSFSFGKNIRLNLGKFWLLIKEYCDSTDNLIKNISKGPFVYYKYNNYFSNIFDIA